MLTSLILAFCGNENNSLWPSIITQIIEGFSLIGSSLYLKFKIEEFKEAQATLTKIVWHVANAILESLSRASVTILYYHHETVKHREGKDTKAYF